MRGVSQNGHAVGAQKPRGRTILVAIAPLFQCCALRVNGCRVHLYFEFCHFSRVYFEFEWPRKEEIKGTLGEIKLLFRDQPFRDPPFSA